MDRPFQNTPGTVSLFAPPTRGGASERPPMPHHRLRAAGGPAVHFRGGLARISSSQPRLPRAAAPPPLQARPPGHASWGVRVHDPCAPAT